MGNGMSKMYMRLGQQTNFHLPHITHRFTKVSVHFV